MRQNFTDVPALQGRRRHIGVLLRYVNISGPETMLQGWVVLTMDGNETGIKKIMCAMI